jgi:hypothetical protein
MFVKKRLAIGVVVAIVAGAGPAAADVVFTDNTMNLADYSASPTFTSDPSVSLVDSNPASPLDTLQFTATFSKPGNPPIYSTALGLTNNAFLYDPSIDGAIGSVDASVFKNAITGFTGIGFGNTFRPTILQDGVYYSAAIPGATFNGPNTPGGTGFNLFSQPGLGASAFLAYDFTTGAFGTAHPDFDGDPMLFGLTQITTVGSTETSTFVTQYQDLSFDIHGAPEPDSLALLGASLLGLFVLRLGRRRPLF